MCKTKISNLLFRFHIPTARRPLHVRRLEIFVLVTGPGKVHVRGHWRSLHDEALGAAVGDAPGREDRPHDGEGGAGEDDEDKFCVEKDH